MLEITFWDVQHGNAIYIKTPTRHIVQDLGIGSHRGEPNFSPLLHLRNKYNVQQLDEVIITHPHCDHIDDIFNFSKLYPLVLHRPNHLTDDEIWAGNPGGNEDVIRKYLEINQSYNHTLAEAENPNTPANNGGVSIQFFVSRSLSRANLNNHSIVTILSYENCKAILPGDNEPASWRDLLNNQDFIRSISGTDIFLAPHHGRESGFCSDIFDHFRPRLTVISDGPYGDTSATSRYSQVTQGWVVHRRNGQDDNRKCVSTRADGVIYIKIGRDPSDNRPFISVTID